MYFHSKIDGIIKNTFSQYYAINNVNEITTAINPYIWTFITR